MSPEQVLEMLLKAVVDYPDQVKIVIQTDEQGVLMSVRVAKQDMGVVIGKSGVHAKALKLWMKLVGFHSSQNISVKILEPV